LLGTAKNIESKIRVDKVTRSSYYEEMKELSQQEIDYLRIGKAILFLNEKVDSQPGLEEVASHAGVSPYHFQRLFTRWAGVSPKRYLSLLTLNRAKGILENKDATLLDAAFGSGLSGTGRLHDLFVNLEAMTPGEYKSSGRSLEIRYGYHTTPFGRAIICVTDRGVCGLAFMERVEEQQVLEDQKSRWRFSSFRHDAGETATYIKKIFSARKGGIQESSINCLVKGSPFQCKVWEALLAISTGRTSTYGQVASAVENPQAARAVGNAVGANPIAYLIPCHRVIKESGALGGYRWGTVRKQAMLAWESA
jgi:AraC family transcriptional regulator, regulatory protein of adaptative response / methylated-DNA-[protein]-cysteine methyltransferase